MKVTGIPKKNIASSKLSVKGIPKKPGVTGTGSVSKPRVKVTGSKPNLKKVEEAMDNIQSVEAVLNEIQYNDDVVVDDDDVDIDIADYENNVDDYDDGGSESEVGEELPVPAVSLFRGGPGLGLRPRPRPRPRPRSPSVLPAADGGVKKACAKKVRIAVLPSEPKPKKKKKKIVYASDNFDNLQS